MNATKVQGAMPATEALDAISETADHQQLTVQQVRRMIYYVVIKLLAEKNVNRRTINNSGCDNL